MDFSLIFCGFLCMVVVGGCVVAVVVWVWGFDLWEWVLGCGVAVAAWGRDCGWVLILLRAVVMETTPVEAWISASNGF